ncbi:MAG: S1 RNA-binding domain-containing protein, partial [Candidatus Lindowbacteria bacterium]|nr:S1 RNA-binding domain-containing protein [Candidatus Lindowbacteria bacterium]
MKQRFVAPSMDDAIDEITSDKDIDINTIREAIENAVSEAYQQQYKTGLPVKTELKPNGELIIKAAKTVVEEVSEERTEIAQSDPLAAGYGLGDEVFILVSNPNIDKKKRVTDEFGRVAALTAKQVIRQKLREAERRRVYEEYKGKEGEMVHGTVQRIRHGTIIVDLGRTEAILPRRELIPRERFVENDRIKAVIYEVRMDNR